MLITTVITLFCLGVLLLFYVLNESERCLPGPRFSVSLLCSIYVVYWLLSYIYCKKKAEEITKEFDQLFVRQNRLLERIASLQKHEQEQQIYSHEQLRTSQT